MKSRNVVVSMITAVGLVFAAPALAEDKHDHSNGHKHDAEHGHAESKPHFETAAFSNVKDAWAAIIAQVAEAEKNLGEKKLEPVHRAGEQIEGAVHTLEEKSDMVAADAKPNLTSALKQLDKAVDDLHHAAEKADQATAELSLKKIKGLLPLVEGLYPAGTLK